MDCGASAVFDYHAPDVVEQTRKAVGPNLSCVYVDAISENGSIEASTKSITSPSGGTVSVVVPVPESVEKALPAGMKTVAAGARRVAESPEIRDTVYTALNALLQSGKLLPNPVKVVPGGLNGVKEGLLLGKAGKIQISGEKLVYRIAESTF